MIYLDSGATSFFKPPSVARAVAWAQSHCASPGRGGYPAALEADRVLYRCRETAGELFDCAPEQVVFTMNCTHGLNMAIKTLVPPGGRAVISGFEHNAVLRPLHALGAEIVVAGRKLFDREDTLGAFRQALEKPAHAVICTHVSNVFGYILPIEELAALCRARGVPLIVDAAQSAGHLPVSLKALGAAFIAMPGHKGLYGPQGTGLLLCGVLPRPLMEGGTGSVSSRREMPDFLPDRGEAGTPNVPGICGLGAGMRFVAEQTPEGLERREQALIRRMAAELEDSPARLFLAQDPAVQAGVLSLIPGSVDCETAAERLGRMGCAVRAGLHCAPLAHESAGTAQCGTVRVSTSAFTDPAQIRRAAGFLRHIMAG